jgi:hypothetical protein
MSSDLVNGSLSNNPLGHLQIPTFVFAPLLGRPDGLDVSIRHSVMPNNFTETYPKPLGDLSIVFTRPVSESDFTA